MTAALLTRRPIAVSLPKLAPVGRHEGNFSAAWPLETLESVTVGWNYPLRPFSKMLPAGLPEDEFSGFVCEFIEVFEDIIDGTVRPLDAVEPPPEVLAALQSAWSQARERMMTWTGKR